MDAHLVLPHKDCSLGGVMAEVTGGLEGTVVRVCLLVGTLGGKLHYMHIHLKSIPEHGGRTPQLTAPHLDMHGNPLSSLPESAEGIMLL